MGKNDFDIDFDFEEEYGFDPKAFLGTEEYDKNIDLDAFSDEELGLTTHKAKKVAAEEDFHLDDDLDADDFLNMGSKEETETTEVPEKDIWSDEAAESQEENFAPVEVAEETTEAVEETETVETEEVPVEVAEEVSEETNSEE